MPTIPPWLHTPDVAGEYTRGLAIGTQVAESHARLQQQQQRMQMEAQIQSQQIQKQSQLEQARLQTAKAYHEQQMELQKQRLGEVAKMNAARTQAAAGKLAAQQKFAQLVGQGTPTSEALYQVPELATPSAVMAANKQQEDVSGQRLDLQRQGLDLSRQRLEDARSKTPTREIPTLSELQKAREGAGDDPAMKARLDKLITQRIFGPDTGAPAAAPAEAPAKPGFGETVQRMFTPPAKSETKTGKVRVRHPDGRPGSIDRDKLDAALKAGYTLLE